MSFNLYFAGLQSKETNDLMLQKDCCILRSQVNDRKSINEIIEFKKQNPNNKIKIFIDSGAYTTYTKQKEVDVDEYIEYINSIDEYVECFAQVDKIPGEWGKPKTQEQILEAPEISWNNYLYMRTKVKSPNKLIPIFHRREDFKYLKQMLETTFDGEHIPYIGLAPTTDSTTKEKEQWFEKCFEIIEKSSNPNVKVHAFGMTNLRILQTFPFYSADSTSWLMTGSNGSIMTHYGVVHVSEQGSVNRNHVTNLSTTNRKEFESYINSRGFTLEELSTNYKKRANFNVLYLLEWSKNYKLIYNTVRKRTLF